MNELLFKMLAIEKLNTSFKLSGEIEFIQKKLVKNVMLFQFLIKK